MQIGVETLAHAAKLNPDLSRWDAVSDELFEPKITNADKFAAEILKTLNDEEEDGTTLIHIALDTATINAVENGAEGIILPP